MAKGYDIIEKLPTIIKNVNEMIEENGPPFKIECDNEFNKKDFLDAIRMNTMSK